MVVKIVHRSFSLLISVVDFFLTEQDLYTCLGAYLILKCQTLFYNLEKKAKIGILFLIIIS